MVIGNGVGNRAGLIGSEHRLQSVVFAAHLIFGHLVLMLCAKHIRAARPYRKIHPAMAKNAAALLSPAAQKRSSVANSPWVESIPVRPSVRCISGPRISFVHATTAMRSRTADKTPRIFAASTIVSTAESAVPTVRDDRRRQGVGQVDRLRFGRHRLQTIAAGKIVVN